MKVKVLNPSNIEAPSRIAIVNGVYALIVATVHEEMFAYCARLAPLANYAFAHGANTLTYSPEALRKDADEN